MRVLIVDDEPYARDRLRRLLGDIGEWTAVDEAESGERAIAVCEREMPDLVLMDVRMPGISGVEAARHLSAFDDPPAVIFVSAYDEYALEAFDARAVGYLVKPVRRERLAQAIEHAARPTRAQLSSLGGAPAEVRTHIAARVAEQLQLIPISEIVYFQADQKYTSVFFADGEVLIDEPLKDLETEFANEFLRVHRNALVSLRHLRALERDDNGHTFAVMDGGARIAVSRRHASAVRKRLRGRT